MGAPSNGLPTLSLMGGATVFFTIRIASHYRRSLISSISKLILTWLLLKPCCIDKHSEMVLINKVILATLVNIINMFLRARYYKFWAADTAVSARLKYSSQLQD